MLRSSLFVVWSVIGCCMRTAAQEWIRHPISCDFESGQCGWHDSGNTTLHWTMDNNGQTIDHYMALDMDNAQVNEIGMLSSPLLHGSLNQTCRLSFTRHIKSNNHACQLTVFMVTGTNWTLLWRTSDITGASLGISWHSERSPGLQWSCTEPNFKIVFEGRKIGSGSCGGTVDVDDIEFYTKQQQPFSILPSTTTTTTTTRTTTTQFFPSTSIATSNTQLDLTTLVSGSVTELSTESTNTEAGENKSAGLSSGAVAAVVAGVVAALVVLSVVVVVVVLLRRRAQYQGQTPHCILCLCTCRTPPKTQPPTTQSTAPDNVVFRNSHDSPSTSHGQANTGSGGAVTSQGEGHVASGHLYSTIDDHHQYSTLDHQLNTQDEHRQYSALSHQRNTQDDHRQYSALSHQRNTQDEHRQYCALSHQRNTQDDHRYSALGHQHRIQGNSPADYQNCAVDHAQYSALDHQHSPHDDHRYSCLDPTSPDDNRHSAADDYITLADDLDDGYERPSPSGENT